MVCTISVSRRGQRRRRALYKGLTTRIRWSACTMLSKSHVLTGCVWSGLTAKSTTVLPARNLLQPAVARRIPPRAPMFPLGMDLFVYVCKRKHGQTARFAHHKKAAVTFTTSRNVSYAFLLSFSEDRGVRHSVAARI